MNPREVTLCNGNAGDGIMSTLRSTVNFKMLPPPSGGGHRPNCFDDNTCSLWTRGSPGRECGGRPPGPISCGSCLSKREVPVCDRTENLSL